MNTAAWKDWLARDTEMYRASLASVKSRSTTTPETATSVTGTVTWIRARHHTSAIFDEQVKPLLEEALQRAPEARGRRQLAYVKEEAPTYVAGLVKNGVGSPEEVRAIVLSGRAANDRRKAIMESQPTLDRMFDAGERILLSGMKDEFQVAQARWLEQRQPWIRREVPPEEACTLWALWDLHVNLASVLFEKEHDFDSFLAHVKLGTALLNLACYLRDQALGEQIQAFLRAHSGFHVVAVIGAAHDPEVALRGVPGPRVALTKSVASSPLLESASQLRAASLAKGIEGLDTEAVLRDLFIGRIPATTPPDLRKALDAKEADLLKRGQTWEQLFREAAQRGQWPQ